MRPLIGLAALALAATLASPVFAQEDMPAPGTISIQGHGEVYARPDTAFVTTGVTTNGNTAAEALAANSQAMADLIAALKEAGIEDRDIQTSNFMVSPNYVYTDATDENGYTLPPKISGYYVSNNVDIRVRDLESLGEVLDQAVTVGANTINGVTFSVADPSQLLDDARKAAFEDAQAKAEVYGGVAGLTLDRITSINESYGYNQPMPYMMREMSAADAAGTPVPVEVGELSYTIDVSVTWEFSHGTTN
jgi:uncharacterized protein YggE